MHRPPTSIKILRLPTVIQKTGLKRSSIYELISAGRFPAQLKLSTRAVGWLESDIDEWIQLRASSARQSA